MHIKKWDAPEQDNKKYQVYVLFELTFVYSFNGKTKEGFLAQQESHRIAKQLDLPEDDPGVQVKHLGMLLCLRRLIVEVDRHGN